MKIAWLTFFSALLTMQMAAQTNPPASGQQPPGSGQQLPAYTLVDSAGKSVSTTDLVREGKWLLAYIQAGSPAGDLFLRTISAPSFATALPKMILVTGRGTSDGLSQIVTQNPALANLAMYADPSGATITQLKLGGAPVVLGMQAGSISWKVKGMPMDSDKFRSMLLGWSK